MYSCLLIAVVQGRWVAMNLITPAMDVFWHFDATSEHVKMTKP
jgi:hypothetical protein